MPYTRNVNTTSSKTSTGAAPATASATPRIHVSAAATNGAISTTVANPPTLIGTKSGIPSRIAISSDRRRYSAYRSGATRSVAPAKATAVAAAHAIRRERPRATSR